MACGHSQLPGHWTITHWLDKIRQYHFFAQVRYFFWEESYLFKYCPDQIIRRCIPEEEQRSVLNFCHELACGGHFSPRKIAEKILQSGFYWPTLFKDSFKSCANCQKFIKFSRRDMMPLNPILKVKNFDVWGIDFMGPFPNSFRDQFILITVDYSCQISQEKYLLPFWHPQSNN